MTDARMKKQAFLIGINEYQFLSKLKFAKQDAEAVEQALRRNYSFSDDEVMLLTDAKPGLFKPSNRRVVLNHLEKLANQELDLFIFGFWGHGVVRNGKRYLCPLDVMPDAVEELGIRFDDLMNRLADIRAKNTCIILDCCQKSHDRGSSETMTKADRKAFENAARDIIIRRKEKAVNFVSNIAILNSCKQGQAAYEWDKRKHGIFTAHLLDAMDNCYSKVSQIASYIGGRVEKTAMELGKVQTPLCHLEGDIVLPANQNTVNRTHSRFQYPDFLERIPDNWKIAAAILLAAFIITLIGFVSFQSPDSSIDFENSTAINQPASQSALPCTFVESKSAKARSVPVSPQLTAQIPTVNSCQYEVKPEDQVYFRVGKVVLKPGNLPLNPFFRFYDGNGNYINQTWSKNGTQICPDVSKKSWSEIYFDKNQAKYRIDVMTVIGSNALAAQGTYFDISRLIDWADKNPDGKSVFTLKISEGNTIDLAFDKSKNDIYFFHIVSYKIGTLNNTFLKDQLLKNNLPWISFNDKINKNTFKIKEDNSSQNGSVTLVSNENPTEYLLSCNKDCFFEIKNSYGTLERFKLNRRDIVDQLSRYMLLYPSQPEKWIVKLYSDSQSELLLTFNGIHRTYVQTRIVVPENHPARTIKKYENGKAPRFKFTIEKSGKAFVNYQWNKEGWKVEPETSAAFSIREGINSRYTIRIADYKGGIILCELIDITDRDFKNGMVQQSAKDISQENSIQLFFKQQ